MTMKTYPRSVQRPIRLPRAQPVIVREFHLQSDGLTEEYTQLLAGFSAEQDMLLAPFEKTDGNLPDTWRAVGSMA